MLTCIYCRSDKPLGEFNREHVVPDSFGRFKGALVLRNTVCRECNDYFGRFLDRGLARESLEGLERYKWGIKAPSDAQKFRYSRVRLTADVSGDFEGCLLELREDRLTLDGVTAVPMAQIGFARTDGQGFQYFPMPEFYDGSWRQTPNIDPRRGVKIIGGDEHVVMRKLEEFGFRMKNWRQLEHPEDGAEMRIDQVVRFPQEHLRAVAKIAFNYLAYVHGPRYALREEFDSTRRFIRYGRQPFLPAVRLSNQEIFRPNGVPKENGRAVAHIVTVTTPLNAEVTLGQVTLFNWMRYDVVLAYSVVPELEESGHLFEPHSLTVHRLGKKRRTQ